MLAIFFSLPRTHRIRWNRPYTTICVNKGKSVPSRELCGDTVNETLPPCNACFIGSASVGGMTRNNDAFQGWGVDLDNEGARIREDD